jgi:uncharacterized membrane protein YphA (DoxX/SURF4 family)
MKTYKSYLLTILRILIGWHFLYEGITKVINPDWTAKYYLLGSKWVFAGFFHWIASSPNILKFVDIFNSWGLILIGFFLFIGLFMRWSSLAGATLLFLYFIAYPPIPGYTFGVIAEGNYQWVDKNLIELFALIALMVIPAQYFYGVDRWISRWKQEKPVAPMPKSESGHRISDRRRELLRDMISVPFLGAFAYAIYRKKKWDSFERKILTEKPDSVTGATLKSFQFTSLEDLKGTIPKGKIGNFELSRLIMGGNLIGGWSHARDLIYVDKLIKTYHTDERVIITLQLAEKCGINAIISNPQQCRIVNKYRHETGGKMQFISDCGVGDSFIEGIEVSMEGGANAMYSHGGRTDIKIYNGDTKIFDDLEKGLELIRSYGKPAGIGAHRIETVQACVENGIKPDFWVKTLHSQDYWSAQVDTEKKDVPEPGWKDNNFCLKPQETIEYMNQLEEPWIAFKTLAAGAIYPAKGFQYAFNSGADFICVGMYDFQIVEDCNIALDSLAKVERIRPWQG